MHRVLLSAFKGKKYAYKTALLQTTNLKEIIDRQMSLPVDIEKSSDWKVFPYLSCDAIYHGKTVDTYMGTGVLLMDIDSREVYSNIRGHYVEFFKKMPSVIVVWPSFSKKLHIAFFVPQLYEMQGEAFAEEYERQYRIYMCRFCEAYKELTGTEIYDIKEGEDFICDCHNARLNQAIALNHIEEYLENKDCDEDEVLQTRISEMIAKYPHLWGVKNRKYKVQYEPDCDISRAEEVAVTEQDGKYLVDKNFCVKGFCGNSARFRIAKAVLDACAGDVNKATQVIRAKFSNSDEIIANLASVVDYKTNRDIEQWVRQYVIKAYEADKDKTITLADNEYVSDYSGRIMSHILLEGRNVYVKAGCGTGKSTFYKKVLREQKYVIVCVHMNSLKEGVFSNNEEYKKYVITTSQLRNLIKRGETLPCKMIVVWNSLQVLIESPSYSRKLDKYMMLFDESHNLVTSLDYRHKTIYAITSRPFARTIFCSATPAGEHILLGADVARYEFRKANSRETTYTQLVMCDGQGNEVAGENRKLYDYVHTIKEYIVERYDEYDAFLVFDNRNHEIIAERLCEFCVDFCLAQKKNESELVTSVLNDNKVKKKVFITTSFGTEGIEVKTREDVVGYNWDEAELMTKKCKVKKLCALFPVWNLTTVDVEQAINRFRDLQHVDVVFVKSDDAREFLSWGVGQEVSLSYMSGAFTDDIRRAEVRNYDRYYADSSTYFPSIKLAENVDEVLTLSQLQYNHKHYNSLTSKNLKIMYPDLRIVMHEYAHADNARNMSSMKKYKQFRHDNFKVFFNSIVDDAEEIEVIASNYVLNDDDKWERTAVARKAMRNDVKALHDVTLYACDLEEGRDVEPRFLRGLTKLASVFVYADGLHINVLKRLLKTRFLLRQGDDYLREVGDNAEQRKANEDMKRWYYKKVAELTLAPELDSTNYDYICAMCDTEIVDIKKDKRGRKREKKYKFALISDEDIKFYSKEEAFNYIKPEGVEISSFIRRKWVEYIARI